MDITVVVFWVILAVGLAIGEIFTTSFFLLPFAIGCVAAAILALFGVDLVWQIVAMGVVSVICLFALRPFARRVTHEEPQKTGINRVMGMQGTMLKGYDGTRPGKARLEGEEWLARSADDAPIAEGTRIVVRSVDGVTVIVEPVA